MGKTLIAGIVIAATALAALPAAAEVNVNVSIGPPPVIFSAPPRVVVVPKTPVYYAPDTSYNVFFYDGRYYSFHNGAWFLAASHGGPWAFVPVERVPRPVVLVPVKYYTIPPGHMKKITHGHDDDDRWRGRDHCPPGQAKKGRC
ncbi:MAG: hypothetical protein FJZ38_00465 [Candidatus Rokubacteria bacterium]|nr:hypothetical protein [Candidatus Rokubacteria bacterium]